MCNPVFLGTVVRGEGKGKNLGYPTANLAVSPFSVGLNDGVYAVWLKHHDQKFAGALCVQTKIPKVEVHILDFPAADLYGQELAITVVAPVSSLEKFTDEFALIQKIGADVQKVRELLPLHFE